ncbi:LptF/LptG family permease [Pseudohoeflea coraliihabitans]|uniref:LptF/LptG family permease n=1 Tax=Pseudohoeflea coraliihabitans TaxID=2860393 RepID=A0ABS6WUH3_9HYPH|nr:LptF/LptG family permease [Pseudohoeflea sp. DP4N28-3]MBW3098714.1 LptF/LptG family permease [Pseudohoeflea sp. DP4N28-3]
MMKQFERYLLRRMTVVTFWALVWATLLVLTTQVLLRLNILTASEQALFAFLKVALVLIPSVLGIVAPFALLIGVGQVLNSMNADSELVVMEAAGAGPASIFRPILVLSAAIAALTFANSNLLEPRANRALGDTLAAASADLLSVAVRSGSFKKLADGLYVHIGEMYAGGEFGGVFLSDRRSEDEELVYYAERGRLVQIGEEQFMLLADGQAHQRSGDNQQISIVSFDSYAIDLSSFLPTGERGILRPREQTTAYLLNPPEDDFFRKNYPEEIEKRLVGRLTHWVYPLMFGLIGCIFLGKAHSNRQDQVQSIVLMTAGIIALRGFGFYSAEAAGQSEAMRIAAYGVPYGATAIYFLLAVSGFTFTVPKVVRRRIEAVQVRIDGWVERVQKWSLRRGRKETRAT